MSAEVARVSIESLCASVTSGGTPSRADPSFWEEGVIPWFKTGELKDWYVDDAEEKITAKAISKSSAKVFPPSTILMAMYGDGKTITSLGILRTEAATNQACCAMIVDPARANFLYLFYALKYHRHEMLQLVVAGAQRNLSGGIIRKFKISWFPLPVQDQIANLLATYDDLIENNRRRMALLEDSARLLYREWFVRLRFPGYEHTPVVDGVPHGWERKTLESVCLTGNGIQTGPFGSQLHQADYSEEGVPVVMPKDLVDFRVSVTSIARIPESLADSLGRHRMIPGDTVYGRRGDIGRRAYIGKRQHGWFCGTGSLRIRPDPQSIDPLYLFDHLGTPATVGDITNRAKGSTMLNLSAAALKPVPVLVPSRNLQDIYAEHVGHVREMVEVLDEQNQRLRTARDLLLPRLMTGEVTV